MAKGRARLAIARGVSVWVLEAPDGFGDAQFHAHHAIQLTCSLSGQLMLENEDRRLEGPALAVDADARHRFAADGLTTALRRRFPADRYLGVELEVKAHLRVELAIETSSADERAFEYVELELFISGIRPGGRFFWFPIEIHRISSVFLEPVSLGFYAFISGLYNSYFFSGYLDTPFAICLITNAFVPETAVSGSASTDTSTS